MIFERILKFRYIKQDIQTNTFLLCSVSTRRLAQSKEGPKPQQTEQKPKELKRSPQLQLIYSHARANHGKSYDVSYITSWLSTGHYNELQWTADRADADFPTSPSYLLKIFNLLLIKNLTPYVIRVSVLTHLISWYLCSSY